MNYTPKEAIDIYYPNMRLIDLSLMIFKHNRGLSAISKFYNASSATYSNKPNSDWQKFRDHFKNFHNVNIVVPNRVEYQINLTIKKQDKEIARLKERIKDLELQILCMENLPSDLRKVNRYAKSLINAIELYEKGGKLNE